MRLKPMLRKFTIDGKKHAIPLKHKIVGMEDGTLHVELKSIELLLQENDIPQKDIDDMLNQIKKEAENDLAHMFPMKLTDENIKKVCITVNFWIKTISLDYGIENLALDQQGLVSLT